MFFFFCHHHCSILNAQIEHWFGWPLHYLSYVLPIIKEVWIILKKNELYWIMWNFSSVRQTHHTVSASFTDSHSRSVLFSIFRVMALTERWGRESHCCYGDEECECGCGVLWEKTRQNPTKAALNANVFWHITLLNQHSISDLYLRFFTLMMSGSTRCPL